MKDFNPEFREGKKPTRWAVSTLPFDEPV